MRPLRLRIEPVLESVAIARLCARAGGGAMHTATGFDSAAGRGEEVLGIGVFAFLCVILLIRGFFATVDAE